MNKQQLGLILGGFILIQVFYFGFDTVQLDKDGTIEAGGEVLADHAWDDHLDEALTGLTDEDRSSVENWMHQAEDNDILSLKQLASFWVSKGEWELGGHYLEEIADISLTLENKLTAARTYATGAKEMMDEVHRTLLRQKALLMFDEAIEIEPDNVTPALEKALFEIQLPDGQGPMQSILNLVALSEKFPDEPEIFIQLGRFSIQTGQYDKAKERLERAYELDPGNQEINCLLSTVYKEVGDTIKSKEFSRKCEKK